MPLAVPRMTLVATQRLYGSRGVSVTLTPCPTAVASTVAERPAGLSPAMVTSAGMPPGHDDDAGSV